MSNIKNELIRLGAKHPSLRPNISAVLDKISNKEVTQDTLSKIRNTGHGFLSKQGDEVLAGRGKIIDAIQDSIRGDVALVGEIDSITGDYESFDVQSQTKDSSIGGSLSIVVTVDSDAEPKKSILQEKVRRAWKDLTRNLGVGVFQPKPEVVLSIRRSRDGSFEIFADLGLWWLTEYSWH